jgi:phosphoglycerate dehydrogenase-like enzyme
LETIFPLVFSIPAIMRLVIHPSTSKKELQAIHDVSPECEVINAATEAEAVRAIPTAEAFYGYITPEMLAAATRLKWVQAPRIGLEHYMFPELAQSDVILTNTRGMLADLVADHAFALALSLARELHFYMRNQLEHHWERSMPVVDLPNSTLGIIGLGEIGIEVAKRAAAFGMQVVAVDPRRAEKPEIVAELWKPYRLNDLLTNSDFVVICAPHTPETEKMIRAEQLRLMKKTAYLVNVGRGVIVDLADLTETLRAGTIAGAGLDVFEMEPLPADHPLWTLPNVIITPHAASECPNNKVGERRLQTLLDNIQRFITGEPLRNVVDKPAWY